MQWYEIMLFLWAYLMGSIPSAVWIGKIFYNVDVREHGSGNAGATNTLRILGKRAAIPVLFIDTLKGLLSVRLVYLHPELIYGTSEFYTYEIMLGVLAVIGHIFPVFARFRGGKGIATLLGCVISIHPQAVWVAIGVFTLTVLLTRYISLGSILASFSFPILVILIERSQNYPLNLFSIGVPILVLLTHQKNIQRLIDGCEHKLFDDKKEKEEEAQPAVTS